MISASPTISVGPGGILWVSDPHGPQPSSVFVRVEQARDGRYEITELYVADDHQALTINLLRTIPLGRMEAFANSPRGQEELKRQEFLDRPTLEEFALLRPPPELVSPIDDERAPGAQLPVPSEGEGYSWTFYEEVARVYNALVDSGLHPAPAIATANGVTESKARRWVKEARARGCLPPGRAGKAG